MAAIRTDNPTTRADLIVVGAGIAGLTAALDGAARGLSVVILNKGPAWRDEPREQSTATFYAQGGIAVVQPDETAYPRVSDTAPSRVSDTALSRVSDTAHSRVSDTAALHVSDTVAAGAGLTDPDVARDIVGAGWPSISALIGWGAEFDRDSAGHLLRTREGGHSARRIIHAGGDATGAAIIRGLGARVGEFRGTGAGCIEVIDDGAVLDVLTAAGRAVGVAYLHLGGLRTLYAPTVLLATGGAGQLYTSTTNPAGATADGIALALRAGADVADLEFIQFHPTMLYTAGSRGRCTLISEAVRGEGGRLVDADGRPVTAGVHPMGDLAPRDVVANAAETAMARTGHPCVYLDVRGVRDFATRFPTVSAGIRAAGLDVETGMVPVVPGAHYLCGGVVTDLDAQTTVPGLLAAGEVARTGLHGANRLASNSLLEGAVMGRRAARTAWLRQGEPTGEPLRATYVPRPAPDRGVVQDVMSRWVALRRCADGLAAATDALAVAAVESQPAPSPTHATVAQLEDASLALVAEAVIAAARARTESRGTHLRTDYPDTDPLGTSRRFRLSEGRVVEAVPVAIG